MALRLVLVAAPFWAIVGILVFELVRLAGAPWRRTSIAAPSAPPADACRRCGLRIEFNAETADVFEGMHWLCFHLEFEHDADPDVRCSDFAGCPWWTIAHLEQKVKELGLDPVEVRLEGVRRHADEGF
jgi:hypothetical protein